MIDNLIKGFTYFLLPPVQQVLELVRGLDLTAETQKKIRNVFESEMELGLAKNPPVASSLQMENTFLPELCDGSGLMLESISVINRNRRGIFSLS